MYSNLFYPHRRASWINPLVAFHLTGYILRNVVASLYPASTKPPFVPACPCYSVAQRCAILAEICFIVLWQVLVFFLVGSSWRAWAWAVAVPHIIASASVMSYIFTNHFLNPVSETYDPLAQTTSVTVPRLMDRIHEHFSLHTEHHLFPGMNSDFYPLVTLALEKYFPERYNRMSLVSAWKKLWHRECFAEIQAQPVACRPNDD
jgi:fatty acid desaturase